MMLTKNQLDTITKSETIAIKETFYNKIRTDTIEVFSKFYENQNTSVSDMAVLIKMIGDINTRLNPQSVLNLDEFEQQRNELKTIRDNAIDFYLSENKDPRTLYTIFINFIQCLYTILKSRDNDGFKFDYHTRFTTDCLEEMYKVGDNSQLFFSRMAVSDDYFVDIRPACIYFCWLKDVPNFDAIPNQPLIPTEAVHNFIDGNIVDLREVLFHDIGHSYIMKRQDQWLFNTIKETPINLVSEWIKNMKYIKKEYTKLMDTDHALYKAVKIYVFDITHDRGYQFHLAILRQQLRANKNRDNIKSKIDRNNFKKSYIPSSKNHEHIDYAQVWLCNLIDNMLRNDNLEKIQKYIERGYIIKKYLDITSFNAVPIGITFTKDRINVTFSNEEVCSIYEIELISLSPSNILTNDKIDNINKYIHLLNENIIDSFNVDKFGNIVQEHDVSHESKYKLKAIEIYKLERLINLMNLNKSTNFCVTKLPEIYETKNITVDNDILTIDNGLEFNITEICVEPGF